MAYIKSEDLQARLGEAVYARLTDRRGGAEADDTVGAAIASAACAELDGYLARRFATPIDLSARPELAPVIIARVTDLAEFIAWSTSPFTRDVPPRVVALRAAAVKWFEQVVRGELDLPAGVPPDSRSAADDAPRVSGTPRTLTAEELEGW